jgi:hypothetical protein
MFSIAEASVIVVILVASLFIKFTWWMKVPLKARFIVSIGVNIFALILAIFLVNYYLVALSLITVTVVILLYPLTIKYSKKNF